MAKDHVTILKSISYKQVAAFKELKKMNLIDLGDCHFLELNFKASRTPNFKILYIY